MISQDKFILSKIKDLESRLIALEAFNQLRKIIVKDGSGNNRILLDGDAGVLKISRVGYDVLTTPNVNLVFHSNFSMFREVQMQCNPEQRSTDSSSYIEYYDGQIRINFGDWIDCNMYFECVMKTGAGTGYMRLWNMTDNNQLVEISTTSTTAVSVRSAAISKSSFGTATKDFRESQKIVGGGAAFTDIYIGRVIMRYDF